ncbi:MAG: thiamine pyrophosphate-binding protein [Mycobacteriales bacterium]|nr:thiamine pyrophosphate-binding protein [Mycobacteriales bacterium]
MKHADPVKYADVLADWLVELGYTHCFFLAGGNSMHMLDSCRTRFTCVATVHEVAAGVAVEYFNESAERGRAFALVTAGPGLTNIVTAVAGAFAESRELLVLGGQVKSSDLATDGLRQRGIQEIDGVSILAPITVRSERVERPVSRRVFEEIVLAGTGPRPGPVFIELCLDAQGAPVRPADLDDGRADRPARATPSDAQVQEVQRLLDAAERPVVLLGGGVSRAAAAECVPRLVERGVPLMTTYNGADRVDADARTYLGRPNTWGMRSANVLLQQSDLVVALGTRLGLQQTGFNWQGFAPLATVVQVDIDPLELSKGHPRVDLGIEADADAVLRGLVSGDPLDTDGWLAFADDVRKRLPLSEEGNKHADGFIDPYDFYLDLSSLALPSDAVVPCSSGGAFTVFYQSFLQRAGQVIISDKSLASMGYGLSGAIGVAIAHPGRRVIHTEGDGGFAQNLQELGTVAVNGLAVKTFVLSNQGYASIRMTQRNYFGGSYLGCDTATGLGFPDWQALASSFGIPSYVLPVDWTTDPGFLELFDAPGPALFVVPVDPEQTYFPKITSRVTAEGSMESNPLHLYSPELPDDVHRAVLPHLPA